MHKEPVKYKKIAVQAGAQKKSRTYAGLPVCLLHPAAYFFMYMTSFTSFTVRSTLGR